MLKRPVWIALLAGIVLGATGAVLAPMLVSPVLPRSGAGGGDGVTGEVVAKSKEADRILMTVSGDGGAVLVTVTKRIKEIDLLVEVGDSVTLLMSAYEPFVKDPKIGGVRKFSRVSPRGERREEVPSQGERTQPPAQDTISTPTPPELIEQADTTTG